MNWLELKRGDVLVDDANQRDFDYQVILLLVVPAPGVTKFKYMSLITGAIHAEDMINTAGAIEDVGWRLERAS